MLCGTRRRFLQCRIQTIILLELTIVAPPTALVGEGLNVHVHVCTCMHVDVHVCVLVLRHSTVDYGVIAGVIW